MKKRKNEKIEVDIMLTPETDDEALMNELYGAERREYQAMQGQVSMIVSHQDDPLLRELENFSLSDEEKAVVEQYENLKNMARERLNGDKL